MPTDTVQNIRNLTQYNLKGEDQQHQNLRTPQ